VKRASWARAQAWRGKIIDQQGAAATRVVMVMAMVRKVE